MSGAMPWWAALAYVAGVFPPSALDRLDSYVLRYSERLAKARITFGHWTCARRVDHLRRVLRMLGPRA